MLMDPALLAALDREARPLGKTRSAVVRDAIREWLRRREVERFERKWIAGLARGTGAGVDADAWREAEAWEE